jgi:nitroreductase
MNDVMKIILERRTIRHFKLEELEQILQAGLWVPCAGGRQSLVFVVCQDSTRNEQIGRINRGYWLYPWWTIPLGWANAVARR